MPEQVDGCLAWFWSMALYIGLQACLWMISEHKPRSKPWTQGGVIHKSK